MAARSPRGFGQSGGTARALERVGERWALLIVRDLLAGARRYSDLKAGLPRIPTNILSDRLKELQEAGIVRRVPAVRGGYELTPLGRELEPVVLALERWGWAVDAEPAEGELLTADALAVTLRALAEAELGAGALAELAPELNALADRLAKLEATLPELVGALGKEAAGAKSASGRRSGRKLW